MLLDRIELFVVVAKQQSLAKTARRMHVSSSSVSQRLKSLEHDFGVKLYKRSRHGIELTMAGQMLLTTATQILNELDALRRTLSPQSSATVKTLAIGATVNPSAAAVPTAIAAFQKDHPDVNVRFVTARRRRVEQLLRDGDIDIAVIQNPTESCLANFSCEPFAIDSLVLFSSPNTLIAKKRNLTPAHLANIPLIIREGTSTTQKMLRWLRSKGVTVHVTLTCATPEGVKNAVRKNQGIGILFYQLIKDEVERKEVKVLSIAGLPELSAKSYIVYGNTKPLTDPAAEFLALLQSPATNPTPTRNPRS